RIDGPGRAPGLPERGVYHSRSSRLEIEIDGAGRVVLAQHLVPARSTVTRPVDTPLGVGDVRMPGGRHEDHVRIARIDQDAADVLAVAQTDVRPGRTAVG